jgi:hypothetical protein
VRILRIILLTLTALACLPRAWADETVSREDQFKAAYLFNFLKFVEWPVRASDDVLTVCFAGASGVRSTFESGLENKRAGARRLAVRSIEAGAGLDGCNAIYTDATTLPGMRLSDASQLPILTVSDGSDFAQHVGIIQLFTDKNRLRFDINIDNAQKAGLRISSSLLQLAAQVHREKR